MKGKIIKGIAGFYYVHVEDALHSADGIYECKAKGVFRKDHRKPLVGDDVEMEVIDEAQKKGNITELLPRHSELIRPAVANVDQALVIFAICKPQPNFNLLDRFLIMMQQQDIPCIICFNKQDIDTEGKKEDYRSIYEQAGFQTITVSAREKEGIDRLKDLLPILEAQEDYSNDGLYQALVKYVEEKGCKNGYVMWPIRTAVSGKQMTPAGATEIMEILGKEESIKRIKKGIELLQNA